MEQSPYSSWSDEDLVRAVTVEREDYLPERLAAIESELVGRGIATEARQEIELQVRSDRDLRIRELTGVRGWLLLFVLVVIGNSIAAVMVGASLGIAGVPSLALGLYGCYVFGLLVRKKRGAPKHAVLWLVAGFLVTSLYGVIAYVLTKEFLLSPLYGAGTLAWIMYLEKSRRVAATYGVGPLEGEHAEH